MLAMIALNIVMVSTSASGSSSAHSSGSSPPQEAIHGAPWTHAARGHGGLQLTREQCTNRSISELVEPFATQSTHTYKFYEMIEGCYHICPDPSVRTGTGMQIDCMSGHASKGARPGARTLAIS